MERQEQLSQPLGYSQMQVRCAVLISSSEVFFGSSMVDGKGQLKYGLCFVNMTFKMQNIKTTYRFLRNKCAPKLLRWSSRVNDFSSIAARMGVNDKSNILITTFNSSVAIYLVNDFVFEEGERKDMESLSLLKTIAIGNSHCVIGFNFDRAFAISDDSLVKIKEDYDKNWNKRLVMGNLNSANWHTVNGNDLFVYDSSSGAILVPILHYLEFV